jgi:hypothetical protein
MLRPYVPLGIIGHKSNQSKSSHLCTLNNKPINNLNNKQIYENVLLVNGMINKLQNTLFIQNCVELIVLFIM